MKRARCGLNGLTITKSSEKEIVVLDVSHLFPCSSFSQNYNHQSGQNKCTNQPSGSHLCVGQGAQNKGDSLLRSTDSHETGGSTLNRWPSEGCSNPGLHDYSHAHVQQFLTCLERRFPTQSTGVLILLDQWWVAGFIRTLDLGRNAQSSPDSL